MKYRLNTCAIFLPLLNLVAHLNVEFLSFSLIRANRRIFLEEYLYQTVYGNTPNLNWKIGFLGWLMNFYPLLNLN